MNEPRPRTETTNGFKHIYGQQPNYPMEKLKSDLKALLEQSKADVERRKEEAQLQILKLHGMVAAMHEALPVIDRVIGDPNHTLASLTDFALRRGCDVAERCVDIDLNPDA